MNMAKTIAIVVASAFLSITAAQAATDDQPKNMNGQPLVADQSDMHPVTGRSASMMHHKKMMMMKHHHMMHKKMMMMKHYHHHHHMHKMMPKPM